MRYIGTIPLMSDPCCVAEQSGSAPPPKTAVTNAIVAKVGAAARLSQSAAARAAAPPPPLPPIEIVAHGCAPASGFRKAASPASDTLTHCGSGDFSAS